MKASLQLRMSQQLALTPQLQQAIRLLQLSTQDMEQEVARMLDENPMLELSEQAGHREYAGEPSRVESRVAESDDAQYGDAGHDEMDEMPVSIESIEWGAHANANASSDDEDAAFPEQAAKQSSMREYLHSQLAVSQLSLRDKQVVGMLIDALDEQGYLEQDLAELYEMLPKELAISLDDLETALVQLQYLDQPGIGARSLSECLALQLRALPENMPHRELAIRLVTEHLDLVAAHDFARIKKILRCSDDQLRAAQQMIAGLKPRPAAEFDRTVADYVIPDVLVELRAGRWQVRLNPEAMPKVCINQMYANILQQRDDKTGSPLVAQLQEANWFIRSLQQRFETILRVAQAIVERQAAFLEHGEIAMRPLVLREISEALELHESTVSRSTTQKFMRTPRGVYEFKHFFGSGLVTESGGACSSAAIRELIKQLVAAEDARKPLTDGRMSEILAQQGIVVARRTIAKYREALNILPVNLRKTL
ncbi:MAG: RNA polymerase factor sigma-54 [Gallionella sp.]|nr:RNA polymerase factor sigma-54 [Gallionella sp.]MDD4947476.1 RNA polymerase factor sigma-54 [Gallionella sp.]MDD5611527.1 RNA polymerase factor sigma-54 [Gallionella sp.]